MYSFMETRIIDNEMGEKWRVRSALKRFTRYEIIDIG